MEVFKEMEVTELQETDGGSIGLAAFAVFCVGCFCIGVYNGYNG